MYERESIVARIEADISRSKAVSGPLSLAIPAPSSLEEYRAAGQDLLRSLSGEVEGADANGRDDLSASGRFALACLTAELARGPVSGGDFGIPGAIVFNHLRNRLPDPAALAGKIVVPKNKTGQDRLRKLCVRLQEELGISGPWEVKGEGAFLSGLVDVRSCLVREVEEALEEGTVILSIMEARLASQLGRDGRSAQTKTVAKQEKVVDLLYDRLVAWRSSSFLGLAPMTPDKFDGDWSREGVVKQVKAPWREGGAATARPRSERPDELGCVLPFVLFGFGVSHMFAYFLTSLEFSASFNIACDL